MHKNLHLSEYVINKSQKLNLFKKVIVHALLKRKIAGCTSE